MKDTIDRENENMKLIKNILNIIRDHELNDSDKVSKIRNLILDKGTRYISHQQVDKDVVNEEQQFEDWVVKNMVKKMLNELSTEAVMDTFNIEKIDPDDMDTWKGKIIPYESISDLKFKNCLEYRMEILI